MLTPGPIVALSLALLAPDSSGTEATTSIGVAPMTRTGTAEGSVSEVELSRVEDAIAQGLERGDLQLSPLVGECTDRACWTEVAREQGLTHVFLPLLEQRGPDHRIVLEIASTATGDVVLSVDETCDICGEEEVASTASDLAAELLPRLERLQPEPARLILSGGPPGATIEIDGTIVGTLPWGGELPAGEHTVVLTHEGYLTQSRTLTSTAGVEERIDVALQLDPKFPDPDPPPPPRAGHRTLLGVGGGLTGLGVLGVGAGVGLFVLDGRPQQSTCAPEVQDIDGRCPKIYEATAPAVIAVSAGGVLAATGVALMVVALKRRRAPDDDRVVLRLAPFRRGASLAIRF